MRRWRTARRRWGAIVLALAAGALPAGGAVASADRFVCEGDHVVVEAAEVYVPPGAECELSNASVAGDLVVSEDARFVGYTVDVGGDVRGYHGAFVGLEGDVAGDVHLSDAAFVAGWTRIEGSIRGRGSRLSLFRSRVGGAVTYTATGPTAEVYVGNVRVAGWVSVHGGHAELWYGRLERGLTLSGSHSVTACALTVAGDLTVRWAHGAVRLGPGGNRTCDPERWIARHAPYHDSAEGGWNGTGLAVGGSVQLIDNPHSIWFRRSFVDGDLVCTGNIGPQGVTVVQATVTGDRVGQCAGT